MTEERARELAELTPPPSLSRLVLFLDDLGLRVGFETSFSALETGDDQKATRLGNHDLVSSLLNHRQIEPYEILEFSQWLRRWNERREATGTIRLDEIEKAPLGWDDDLTLWQSPARPLFRPQVLARESEDFAEVRESARTSSRSFLSVTQAVAPVALPRLTRLDKEPVASKTQAASEAATEAREVKVARSPDILDRAWSAAREPESPLRSQTSFDRFSAFVQAGKASSNSPHGTPRSEGEMPLASPAASAPSKSLDETAVSPGTAASGKPSSAAVPGEAEAPIRRSKARNRREVDTEETLPDAPALNATRPLIKSKAIESNAALEPAPTETARSIEPTTARLSNSNTLRVLNRATWSLNAVGGSSLSSYIAGQMAAMPLSTPSAQFAPLTSPVTSPWISPNLPLPSSPIQETQMQIEPSGFATSDEGNNARFRSAPKRTNPRAQASIEVLDEEPASDAPPTRRIPRSRRAARPFIPAVAAPIGDELLDAGPQTPARPANGFNTPAKRPPTFRLPISSPLEALRLPAPALGVNTPPLVRAGTSHVLTPAVPSFLGIAFASLGIPSSVWASSATPARPTQTRNPGGTPDTSASSAFPSRPSLVAPTSATPDSVAASPAGAAPYQAGRVESDEVATQTPMLAPSRDLRTTHRLRLGVPLAASIATATLGMMGKAQASPSKPKTAPLTLVAPLMSQFSSSSPASAEPNEAALTFSEPGDSASPGNSAPDGHTQPGGLETRKGMSSPISPSLLKPAQIVVQGQRAVSGQRREADKPLASSEPARFAASDSTLSEPRWGQLTLVAPALRVASPEAEQSGANLAFNWSSLGASASTLDENGVAQLKGVLPQGAQAIYPALAPGSVPGAMTVALAPTMVARLLDNYNSGEVAPEQRRELAQQLSDRGRMSLGSASAAPVKAEIVPSAQRPLGRNSGIVGGGATTTSAGALQEAGAGQAKRGGALDFLGVPVRLAPSLGGRSELSDEVAVRHAADANATPSVVRPQLFGALRDRLFPSLSSTEAEPNHRAWEKVAPDFGLSDASPQAILAPDNRVKKASSSEPQPAPKIAPQSENSAFNPSNSFAQSQLIAPPLALSSPAIGRSQSNSSGLSTSPSFSSPSGLGSTSPSIGSAPMHIGNSSGATQSPSAQPFSFSSPSGTLPAPSRVSLGAPQFGRGVAQAISDVAPSSVSPNSLSSPGAAIASEPIYSPPSLGRPQAPMLSRGQTLPAPTLGAWASMEETAPAFSPVEPSFGGESFAPAMPFPSLGMDSMATRPLPFAAERASDAPWPQVDSSSLEVSTSMPPAPVMNNFFPRAVTPTPRSSVANAPTSPFSRAPLRVFPASPSAPAAVSIQRSTGPVASPASAPTSGGKKVPGARQDQGSGEDIDALASEVWSVLKRRLDFERQRRGF